TALMALAGLLPLDRGCIEVCGVALDEASADAWRARLAFVPQKAHFADCTLGNWLDPKGSGTDPREALALADAAQIVERLPGGLSATLGERGGGVSGGEARRLMLARAVLSGGDLILADEPTADLDPETAARIIAALERLRKSGRAIIVATHDPDLAGAMMRCIAMPPMTDNGARA
ncbi:MAG: ATP-binding cassette domain-containing protein, partial [Hyphomicrobiaceae bacterium]|nr:ATP-binding cassette domain-containing protein [Hyphomicrobiaceae bacterium]